MKLIDPKIKQKIFRTLFKSQWNHIETHCYVKLWNTVAWEVKHKIWLLVLLTLR